MTTGPGDEAAAAVAGRGRLRASRADREQVIEALKAAFVEERLTRDELDVRVGQAFTSRTYAELAELTADLPAVPAAAPPRPSPPPRPSVPPRRSAAPQARSPVDGEVRTGIQVMIVTAILTVLLWVVAIVTADGAVSIAAGGGTLTVIVTSALTGSRVLGSWLDKRSGGPRPPRPGG